MAYNNNPKEFAYLTALDTAQAALETVAGIVLPYWTAWNTAYLNLIDARAALNLAIQYTADITLTYDNTDAGLEGTQ